LRDDYGRQAQRPEQKKGGINPEHRLRDTPRTAHQV
jgi:hypothetical protein